MKGGADLSSLCLLLLLAPYTSVLSNPCSQQVLRAGGGMASTDEGSYGCVNCCSNTALQTHLIAQPIAGNKSQNVVLSLVSDCSHHRPVQLLLLSWTPVKWVLEGIADIDLRKIYIFQTTSYFGNSSVDDGVPPNIWSLHQDIRFKVIAWPHQVNSTPINPLLDQLRREYNIDRVTSVNLWLKTNRWSVNIGGQCCLSREGNNPSPPAQDSDVCNAESDSSKPYTIIGPITVPILIAIILVSVLVALLFLVLVCWCCRKRKKKPTDVAPTSVGLTDRVHRWVAHVNEHAQPDEESTEDGLHRQIDSIYKGQYSDINVQDPPTHSYTRNGIDSRRGHDKDPTTRKKTRKELSSRKDGAKDHPTRKKKTKLGKNSRKSDGKDPPIYANTKGDIRFSVQVPVRK